MSDSLDPAPENDPLLAGAPYHVYPANEGHEVEGQPCWCNPRIEENGRLIIYNQASV